MQPNLFKQELTIIRPGVTWFKSIVMTMRYADHYPESLRFGVEILDKCVDFTTLDKTKDLRQAVSP